MPTLPASLTFIAGLVLSLGLSLNAAAQGTGSNVVSTIRIYDLDADTTRTVLEAEAHYEAPNWSHDGQHLIFNSEGALYRVPVDGGTPERIETGDVANIINDHGISPDGQRLAFTAGADYHIYTMPIEGGSPTRITEQGPSYWHGWSPDGETLAYVAQRDGVFDVYTLPAEGGPERRLTFDAAHDDGPDYSPDGQYMYWNSDRSGNFDIWRMPAEGGTAEQITSDAQEDWFPHPSPDGRHIVFLSYKPGTEGHPANRDVTLRMITLDGGDPADATPTVLLHLFGGQGTINVPSWSPDGRAFAFVSYQIQ